MCKRLKMLFLPTFPSIKRQRIGSNSFSNTHHIRLLLPKLTIWWGNTKMVYVPTTYQISPSSCHYYASSYYICLLIIKLCNLLIYKNDELYPKQSTSWWRNKIQSRYSLVYICISGNTTIIKRLLFFRTNRIILLCQHTSIVVRIIPIDKKNSS